MDKAATAAARLLSGAWEKREIFMALPLQGPCQTHFPIFSKGTVHFRTAPLQM
jgi:hypothetical protein